MSNIDRKDLKIQALLEKVSSLTTQYENQVADLRVEITVNESETAELRNQLATAQQRLEVIESPTDVESAEVVQGEVVQEDDTSE